MILDMAPSAVQDYYWEVYQEIFDQASDDEGKTGSDSDVSSDGK